MRTLGIDPGLNGGLAFRSENVKDAYKMPLIDGRLDLQKFREIIEQYSTTWSGTMKAFVEDVHAIFGSSAKNTFEFGRVCGQIEATLSALSIPFEFVNPTVWQKEFFSLGGKLAPKERKERCLLAAKRLFPEFDFRATERSTTPHLGKVDALLIAEYGWRKR